MDTASPNITDGGDASPPQPRGGDTGCRPLPGSGARLPGSSTDPPSPSNVLQNENEPSPQESVLGGEPPPPQESMVGSEPPTPQKSMVVNEPLPPQESMIVNEPLSPQESTTPPPLVGFSAPTEPLPDAARTEYPTYVGLSAPGRKSLAWRPYTMRPAYLLFQVAALATTVAILVWLLQRNNYGFSERSFQGYSWGAVAMFKITPAAIALAFQVSWFAIDQDFKRMMPFINMANPKIGRRGCFGNRNSRPGARGRQSLVAYYYPYMSYAKDFLAGFQDRTAVSTSTLIYFLCMGGVSLQLFLFQTQIYTVPVPVNVNSGSHFWRIATWQQRLDHSYATGVAKKLAVSELGLVLAHPTKRSRQSRAWWGGTWAALPFVLGSENGTTLFRPTSERWRADTVVFHGSLDCEPAGAQTETRDGTLVVSFRDSAGCSAQQLFPAPPAGQFLSFWNASTGGGPECRGRQLIAWGSAMSPSSVSWNTISCAPKYQTASVPVFQVGSGEYLGVPNAEHMYTSNIAESKFPTAASEFSSPGLAGLINQVFFNTGLAASGRYPANQAPFFRGYPPLIRTIDNPKGLLDRSNLIASAQRSFEQVSSRIFAVALSTTNPAPVGSLPTTAASNGMRYILVERWGLLPIISVMMISFYSTALCGAISLLLSVALMRKYRETGLKFDITTAGTAGLMLLLHRSRRVLDEDFTDLDQSTRSSELTKRLGEKLYRLGYWRDARGLFWGISREAGEEEGIASEKPGPYSHIRRSHAGTSEGAVNIPRIPSGKFDSFRHRRSRPDLHPLFVVILFGLSVGFACLCLYLVIQSRRHQGLDPIVGPIPYWKMSFLWAGLPSYVTLFIFSFWWRNVDMYFRCTQPFVNMPGPANENIAADYRTTLSIYLPFTAATKRQWDWFLVSCATLLMPVMIGFGGALFVFGFPIARAQAQFRHTHTWRTDSFATPNLEQYVYESVNSLFGADTQTSWTDPLGLHLPLEVVDGPESSNNLTTPLWHVDTQRVSANFSRCIPLDVETDLSIKTRRITVNGTTGRVVDSVELANVTCPSGTTISPPCVPSRDNSTTPAPEGLCSIWKLLPSSGNCDYAGWWWLYWQFGDVFASDATGQPVFAQSPPLLAVSFLCETSIWLQDVSFVMGTESKIVLFENITVKRTEVFDSVDRDYKNTFNSLLNTTLAEIRDSSDSTDPTALLMESFAINRTNISSTFGLGVTASFLYGDVFNMYTRNEEILWAPLINERGPPPTSNGSISWLSVRVTARPHSVGLYIACILIIIITIAIAAPSLKRRKLPRVTNCLASEITYFYRSPVILEDFSGLDQDDVPDTNVLVTRLMLKNRRYVFGEGIGRDGVPFIGIGDESYMRHRGSRGGGIRAVL